MSGEQMQTADEEAVRWFVLLRDDDISAEERAAFEHWLAVPAHAAAWHETQRLWGALDELPPSALRPVRRPVTWRPLAAAAAVAALAFLGWQTLPPGLGADHRTGVGDRALVTLADGSRVDLDTATAIDVDFSAGERRVTLRNGAAYFSVTPDAARPFVVATSEGEIRVLGTEFDVRVDEDVTVAVTHNSVSVRSGDVPAVTVREGESVTYGAGVVSPVALADLDAVGAWRSGKLVFRDVPLGEVLRELGRYRYGQVVLLDADLRDRKVTAVFDTGRIDAAIATIAETLKLRVLRATPLLTALAPA